MLPRIQKKISGPTVDQFTGCFIGCCVGDACGFPVEGFLPPSSLPVPLPPPSSLLLPLSSLLLPLSSLPVPLSLLSSSSLLPPAFLPPSSLLLPPLLFFLSSSSFLLTSLPFPNASLSISSLSLPPLLSPLPFFSFFLLTSGSGQHKIYTSVYAMEILGPLEHLPKKAKGNYLFGQITDDSQLTREFLLSLIETKVPPLPLPLSLPLHLPLPLPLPFPSSLPSLRESLIPKITPKNRRDVQETLPRPHLLSPLPSSSLIFPFPFPFPSLPFSPPLTLFRENLIPKIMPKKSEGCSRGPSRS
jgi:hypothetical protein